jgi:hypothetical protein
MPGPLSIDAKLHYARQAAEALDYAHERGATIRSGCLLQVLANPRQAEYALM